MDKLLRDIEASCKLTTKKREEFYRKSCSAANIIEWLLSDDEIRCDGDTEIRIPIETEWREQQLTDEEMAIIKGRDDQEKRLRGKHQDHMLFIIDEGDVVSAEIYEGVDSILFHDREDEGPCYGKACNETFDKILSMVDELQDMIELFEYMGKVEDCSTNDVLLNLLEANLSTYNEGT